MTLNGKLLTNLKEAKIPDIVFLKKSPFKYEYYWSYTNRRNPFDWLMDVKGPKCLDDAYCR